MLTDGQMFAALSALATALGTAIWYLIRRSDSRLDFERNERLRTQEAERAAREAAMAADRKMFMELFERAGLRWMEALEEERRTAKADRHEFRDELSKWANLFQAYKLEAVEKFVNVERLSEVLAPLKEAMDAVRKDQRELFERLHSKVDK